MFPEGYTLLRVRVKGHVKRRCPKEAEAQGQGNVMYRIMFVLGKEDDCQGTIA